MSKQSGLSDNYYVGGYDLSGDVNALSKIASPRDVLDFTAVKNSAYVRQVSLKQGEMDFTSFFNPTAAVSSPSVPLTTVPYVSTYNDPVLVTVIGGTGTNVSINGVLQGTFDGTYVLPALGTIILTYSGAPTWSWTAIAAAHTALSALPRTDTIATWFRGQAVGNPAASVNAKQVNYDGTRGTDASFTFAVQAIGNAYGLEWGEQLTAGARTDTAATTGAAHDDGAGAATTFGGQAYFHLLGFVGTSVTIDIQSATTSGGSYATTGLTTTAMTSVGSQRLATASTINEFTKVVTTGTFTYAKFAVNFVRNAAAVTF
jgi:hypothetical protein